MVQAKLLKLLLDRIKEYTGLNKKDELEILDSNPIPNLYKDRMDDLEEVEAGQEAERVGRITTVN
jgi:hypothetical protein